MATITVIDSSTITPALASRQDSVFSTVKVGEKISIKRGEKTATFSITGRTAYQLYTKGQPIHTILDGACKANPVEISIEVVK
jgi:hypothetical protein